MLPAAVFIGLRFSFPDGPTSLPSVAVLLAWLDSRPTSQFALSAQHLILTSLTADRGVRGSAAAGRGSSPGWRSVDAPALWRAGPPAYSATPSLLPPR